MPRCNISCNVIIEFLWQLHQLILSIHYERNIPWIRNAAARREQDVDEKKARIANYKLEYEVKNQTSQMLHQGGKNSCNYKKSPKGEEQKKILSKWYWIEIIMSFCCSFVFGWREFLLICRHMLWRSMIFLGRLRIIKGHRQDSSKHHTVMMKKKK